MHRAARQPDRGANGDAAHAAPAPPRPAAPAFAAGQVYTIETLRAALSLRRGTLPRELRLGRLRYAKRSGKVLILGEWVLEWIAGGELTRRGRGRDAGE